MKTRKLVLKIIKKIEEINPSLFVYAYKDGNITKTHTWWMICVSSFDYYTSEDFKKFSITWHKVSKSQGVEIVFACGWIPDEKKLVKLSEENELILNLE